MTTTPAPPSSLRIRAAAGVAWTAAQQWVVRISGFATLAILTRLLTPAEFGVVALAGSVVPFTQLLATMGLATFLVQRDGIGPRTYTTAFGYSVAAAIALAAATAAVAPLVAAAFGIPELGPVLQVLCLVGPLTVLGMVPGAILRRALRFRTLAMQSVVAALVGQAVAVVLALGGAGVWALVWQSIAFQAALTVLSWISARWLPRGGVSFAELREMFGFGARVVGADLVAMLRAWGENAIVAVALGVTGLGYLSIAQRLVNVAHEVTTTPVTWVSMVVFAQIRETRDRLRAAYLRAQLLAHTLVVPVMVFLAVAAPVATPFLFGGRWEPSILPAQLLAVAGIVTLSGLDNGLLIGLGRPGVWLAYVGAVDAVTIAVAFLTAPHGLVAFATGFLCVAVVATIARWFIVAPLLGTSPTVVGGALIRVLVPAALSAAAGFAVCALAAPLPPLLVLLLAGLAVAAVHVALVRLILPAVWAEITDLARTALRRRERLEKGTPE